MRKLKRPLDRIELVTAQLLFVTSHNSFRTILKSEARSERIPSSTMITSDAALRVEKFTSELIQLNIKRIRLTQQCAGLAIERFNVRLAAGHIFFPIESYLPAEAVTQ